MKYMSDGDNGKWKFYHIQVAAAAIQSSKYGIQMSTAAHTGIALDFLLADDMHIFNFSPYLTIWYSLRTHAREIN